MLSSVTEDASYSRIEDGFLSVKNTLPENIAVNSESGVLTYEELYGLARDVQAIIESHANGNALTVAIVSGREVGLVISVIGTLLAKCSFAILDVNYPEHRLVEYIEVLEPDLLIAIDRFTPASKTTLWKKESYGITEEWTLDLFINSNILEYGSNAIAYWLFTSGTTGTPKCISTNHAPLIHFLDWQREQFVISENDKFSLLSGLSHDPVLRDIFAPLSVGACLCIPSDDVVFSAGGMSEWLIEKGVTVIHITPQMGGVISGSKAQKRENTVRLCFIGGDQLRQKDISLLRAGGMKEATIVNVYGASETPQVMGYYVVPNDFEKRVVPIGKSIDDVKIFLHSGSERKVGLGEYGQIVIRTKFLSNGYKNDIESNKTNFSLNGKCGEKSYITGDFGYYDENGNIVFVGRGDDQLKIRGYRIEPSDIAAHIEAIPHVERALVLPFGDGDERKLISYIQLDNNGCLTRETVNSNLMSVLPSYMIPSAYVFLESFPLLPNGKINRKVLPAPTHDHVVQHASYVAPATKKEEELVAMWEKALGISPIGVNDTFYDVGGDSLAAIGMMVEMERSGISEEDCRAMFRGGTISTIAKGKGSEVGNVEQDLPIEFLTNILVNCLRGILVILVVAGHWMPGFLQKLPDSMQVIKTYLTPIFNLSTPGFAIVFGITLGYSMFDTYRNQKQRFSHQIKMGIILLFFGLIIKSSLHTVVNYVEGMELMRAIATTSFHNVLGFYLLAVCSIPIWFRFIEYKNNVVRNVLVLIMCFALLDFIVKFVLLSREQEGVLQLIRLYLVAKFAYFNLAAGSLMGFLIGYHIKELINKGNSVIYFQLGLIFMLIGMVIGIKKGEIYELTQPSETIELWKWFFYFGVVNILTFSLWSIIKNYNQMTLNMRKPLNILSMFGVIALPMFVFHGAILAMKDTLDVLRVPDLIGLGIVLAIFFGITIIGIRKLYRLYY